MTPFAQAGTADRFVNLVTREWTLWLPLLVGGLAIYLLLPRPRNYPVGYGVAAGVAALALAVALLLKPAGLSPETVLFGAFTVLALASGGMLVTQQNPARAALSFALVVFSTCGLFLLLAAPFLMAATIIVYAGAIIVTFLFVVMLAQQHGHSDADARSREPALATVTGFLLLGVLLYVIRLGHDGGRIDGLLAGVAAARAEETGPGIKARVHAEGGGKDKTLFNQGEALLGEMGFSALEQQAAQLDWDWNGLGPDNPDRIDPTKAKELLARLEAALLAGKDRLGVAPARPGRGTDPAEVRRDEKTRVPHLPAENAAHLGKALFTEFLLPVELGGTLLLVA
ncbi:MAG: NADH-quinone oxidoreductase subunit J family protein, partial [Gemmataceae bacterium]